MKNRDSKPSPIDRRQFLQLASGAALGGMTLPIVAQSADGIDFEVYKDPSCGCCTNWIELMQERGFTTRIHHPSDLNGIKNQLGIAANWQSCHTAVTAEGFAFEGHVPARYISQFLAAPPENALGLAVPGMPVGSPGMEVGDSFSAYNVMLLKHDGSADVYVRVNSPADQ